MNIRTGFLTIILTILSFNAAAERVKDLVSVLGVRDNQLLGYGLVVGLDGSGDMTTQTPFTVQSITNMLLQMGINLPSGSSSTMQLKNVAAVTVTATLPPFSRPGQTLDITVSSIGNAKSLRGGTLLMTPLKGADGQVYAMAQGNMLVSGAGAAAAGSKTQVNHLNVGRIPDGATVERSVLTQLGQGDYIYLELNAADFTTAMRLADVIDHSAIANAGTAKALDSRTVQVKAPTGSERVEFISRIENLDVDAAIGSAKIIINARTGSVVMNQHVSLDDCAVAHGNLTVVINAENAVIQPSPLSQGKTEAVSNANIEITADKGNLLHLRRGVDLNDVVKALNSIGVTPQDMLAILQAMKAAGALHAELEVI